MLSVTRATDPRPVSPPAWPDLASGLPAEFAWSHASETSGLAGFSWQRADSLHARLNNFNIGRFLSVDPVRGNPRRPQSFNLFAYVGNNPINFVDPLGLLAVTFEPEAKGGQVKPAADCQKKENKDDPYCKWLEEEKRRKEEEQRRKLAKQLMLRRLLLSGAISPRQWAEYLRVAGQASQPGTPNNNTNWLVTVGDPFRLIGLSYGKRTDNAGNKFVLFGASAGKSIFVANASYSVGFSDVGETPGITLPSGTDVEISLSGGVPLIPGAYVSRTVWSFTGQPLGTEFGITLAPQLAVSLLVVVPES